MLLLLLAAAFFMQQDIAAAQEEKPRLLSTDKTDSRRQALQWSIVPGAVSYEVEILDASPERQNGIAQSLRRIAAANVFTNGYQADFSAYQGGEVFWRVRGLALDGSPVGVFSDSQRLKLGEWRRELIRPVITARAE